MARKKKSSEEILNSIIQEEVAQVELPTIITPEKLSFDRALKLYKLENSQRSHYMKDKEVILKFISKHTAEVRMTKVQWFALFDLF